MPKQQKKPPSAKAKAKAKAEAEQQEEEEYAVEEIVDKRLAKDRTVPSRSLCLPVCLSVPPAPPPPPHTDALSQHTR
jgi:hypothetical protein